VTGRIAHVFARCSGTATCSRCTDAVDVTAGAWHAADVDATHRAVCDRCAEASDAAGWTQLLAWRRAARPTRRSAA